MTTKKRTWLRELLVLIVGTVVGGVVVVLFDKALLRERQIVANSPPFEFVTRSDMEKSIKEAKTKIEAVGYVLKPIDPDFIDSKLRGSPNFSAKIVMIDPLGSKRIICQRQYDEDNLPRNYTQILGKVREFIQKSKNSMGHSLQLGLSDVYPTMSVIIVDDDLYAYFFPYHDLGSHSPVIKFTKYNQDERAKFFDNHLRKIFEGAKFLSSEADFKRYELASSGDPCF